MAGVRRALIVATDAYDDAKLARLSAPATDARALAEVLQDPNVGAFEVDQLLNRTCHEVEVALIRFLAAGRRGDTLLLHFSGHGVKDLGGELYFATTDTDLSVLKVTGVASSVVKEAIEESRASLILCLVDCCYSGAFTKSTKAAATLDLTERLGGQGRAVITASTSLQLALDGKEEPSLFTKVVVEGLRSGEADRDLDGLISLDELYSFVHERVTAENPDQTPVKSFDVQGDVYVARRGNPVTTPATLPRNLLETLATGEVWERRGAVIRLRDLMLAGHPGRALAAKLELERVCDGDGTRKRDDSSMVREDAAAALLAAGAQAEVVPEIPVYEESGGTGTDEAAGGDVHDGAHERVEDEHVEDEHGRRPRWRTPWVLGVLGVVVLGGVLAWVSLAVIRDGPTDGTGLPESQMLVPVTLDGTRKLLAVDVDTGESRVVISGERVYSPTLSHDRQWVFYLLGRHRVPYRARVDGSEAAPLIASEDQTRCPSSTRPSASPDGGSIALVCLDGSGDPIGLFRVDADGVLSTLYAERSVTDAPTWTGDGEVVFVRTRPRGPDTLWQIPGHESGAQPDLLTPAAGRSASNPDWSEAGVLFTLVTKSSVGDVHLLDPGRRLTALTSQGDVETATWSADGSRFVFLTDDSGGEKSLWVQDADPDAQPDRIEVDGTPGVPAWGAR